MRKTLRLLLTCTCLSPVVLGAPNIASQGGESQPPQGAIRPSGKLSPVDLPSLAKIKFQQALDAALAKAPGSVIKAELEVDDGVLMYSFEIVGANKRITEVDIDAGNATVLGTEDESGGEKSSSGNEKNPGRTTSRPVRLRTRPAPVTRTHAVALRC